MSWEIKQFLVQFLLAAILQCLICRGEGSNLSEVWRGDSAFIAASSVGFRFRHIASFRNYRASEAKLAQILHLFTHFTN